MRFSLPSIVDSCQPADGLSSIELDGFVFHLAVAANIIQLLLSTSRDIPSGKYQQELYDFEDIVRFEFCFFFGLHILLVTLIFETN